MSQASPGVTWKVIAPMPNQYIPNSLQARFWSKVDTSGQCWIWTGARPRHGYGHIGDGAGKVLKAHRLSWMIHNGPIPSGMCVCHNCPSGDNPACVNPSHLFLGTHKDNSTDMVAKGRASRGEHSPNTHLTADDVRVIRTLLDSGMSQRDIAYRFAISRPAVSMIKTRRTWAHVDAC